MADRMRAATLALGGALVLAMPLGAQTMTQGTCEAGWLRLAGIFEEPGSSLLDLRPEVSADKWCYFASDQQGLETADFDTLAWRGEGLDGWAADGVPPHSFEVLVTGLEPDGLQPGSDTDRPPLTASLALRQVPDAGQLIVERIEMKNDAGDVMAGSMVFERMFLSSQAMLQVSVGSAALKAMLLDVRFGGKVENPFGWDWSVEMNGNALAQQETAFKLISRMPDGVVDDASRAELTAFAGDLPKPVGRMEIVMSAERPIGLMQVGATAFMTAARFLDGPSDDEAIRDELGILFDGVTLSADWTPDAQVAD